MRTRRVGSITCGILMILFGSLFMIHMIFPSLSLAVIMRLWPLILISLGVELIASNIHKGEEQEEVLKYDKGAIFLVFILAVFAAVMAVIEYSMNYVVQYGVL